MDTHGAPSSKIIVKQLNDRKVPLFLLSTLLQTFLIFFTVAPGLKKGHVSNELPEH